RCERQPGGLLRGRPSVYPLQRVEERPIVVPLCREDHRIRGIKTSEVQECRWAIETVLQLGDGPLEVLDAVELRLRERTEDPLAGDLVEVDARQPGDRAGLLRVHDLLAN